MCAIPSVTVFLTFFFALEVVLAITLFLDRFARPLSGPGIGSCALSMEWQAASVANASIYAHIHQTFYIHRHFAAQIAFHRVRSNRGAQFLGVFLAQFPDWSRASDSRGITNFLCTGPAYSVYRGQRNFDMLVYG